MLKKSTGIIALVFALSVGLTTVSLATAQEQQNGETMMTMKKQDSMKTVNGKKTIKKRRTSRNSKRAKKTVKRPSTDTMTSGTMTGNQMKKP